MSIALPKPIADYFQADRSRDADMVARCFTAHAVVRDEGHTYAGYDAIRQWKAQSSTKYTYTVEPFELTTGGDEIVVTSRLVGDFPGSPIDLRYLFKLAGDGIAALEIKL